MTTSTLLSAIMTILVSGTATTYLTELLKFPAIKIPAERYPRITAAVLSVITSIIALLVSGISIAHGQPVIYTAGIIVGAFYLASSLYRSAVKGLPTNTNAPQ